jgi:hypothetical protein
MALTFEALHWVPSCFSIDASNLTKYSKEVRLLFGISLGDVLLDRPYYILYCIFRSFIPARSWP